MTKKIKEQLSNINKLSKNIIIYGSIISFFLIIIGLFMLFFSNDNYSCFVAQEFIKSSISVLAEVIIGSLFIDFVINLGNN